MKKHTFIFFVAAVVSNFSEVIIKNNNWRYIDYINDES